MDLIWRDLLLGWRRLRMAPAFATFSVVTLALGIGATTAIYSVIYTAVLRPPDIRDIDRVANLYHYNPRHAPGLAFSSFSLPDFEDYRAVQTSFSAVSAWARFRQAVVANGSAEVMFGEMVDGQYFSVLEIQAALGRAIQPADNRPDASRVIVLSDGLWRRLFGGDPAVIGRTVELKGEAFEIIGVAPAAFSGVDMPNVLPTAAWVPLTSAPVLLEAGDLRDREFRWLRAKGRLRPTVTMAQAGAELRAYGQQLDGAFPIGARLDSRYRMPSAVARVWHLIPAADLRMHESVDRIAGPLSTTIMLVVALVLLVACTNIANLMLARGASRRHELAVRLAMGASRWRLMREQLAETGLVTVAGAAVAFVVAQLLMTRLLTTEFAGPGVRVRFTPEMNVDVALAALASTLAALIVFGLVPAWQTARANIRDLLASDGQSAASPRWRGRSSLIAFQVAVSAGLIAVTVLFAQQMIEMRRHDSGLDIDRLALARVDLNMQRKSEEYGRRVLAEIEHAARQLPGADAVAIASGLPVGMTTPGGIVSLYSESQSEGTLRGSVVEFIASSPGIFATLGVSIRHGRGFDERDVPGRDRVVVLSSQIAESLFEGTSAVGRTVVVQRRRWVGEPVPSIDTMTVIGIAEETDTGSVGRRRGGAIYLPFAQKYEGNMTVIVRTSGDPAALVEPLRRIVNMVDPQLAVMDGGTGPVILGNAQQLLFRIGSKTTGALGFLALLLAMAGLYGVLSELVTRRTRELGVRMALGATGSRLTRMILRDGIRPVLYGLFVGLLVGVVIRMSFRPFFVVLLPAFDPILFVVVPIPFIAAALLAAYLPARRAARVDPNVALRHL
jgi:predicted permease